MVLFLRRVFRNNRVRDPTSSKYCTNRGTRVRCKIWHKIFNIFRASLDSIAVAALGTVEWSWTEKKKTVVLKLLYRQSDDLTTHIRLDSALKNVIFFYKNKKYLIRKY